MLKYGGVATEEAEVIIRLDKQDQLVHVSSSWAEWSRKFERRYGAPGRWQERDGMVYEARWTLPIRVIGLRSREKRVGVPPKHPFLRQPVRGKRQLGEKLPQTAIKHPSGKKLRE